MTPRLWRAAVVAVIVALLAVGLTYLPSKTVPRVSVTVSGTQSLVCPSQDPAVLATTVRATDTGVVMGRAVDASTSSTVPAAGLTGTAQPHLVSGSQAIGGLSAATASAGDLKGLWMAACSPAATEQAFVGLVADATHTVSLLITNPDPTQATVDIAFYGAKGRITTQGSRGLTVLGNSTRQLALAPLVTDDGPVTAVVTASQGRASTYARVTGADGSDWVSASAAPATSATIAAVPGGTGSRNLVVTNTSDRRTTVSVDVLAASSTFTAAGAESVAIEAASTVTIPVDAAVRGDVTGLRVTATQPVVAALWSKSPEGDLAVSPARAAFDGRSVVPLIPGSVLVASNPGTATASLSVTLLNGSSMVDAQKLTVDPGTSLQVPLTAGTAVQLVTDSPDLRLSTLVTTLNGLAGIGVAAWGPGGPGEADVSPTLDPNLA